MAIENQYMMDQVDLWTAYGVIVEKGSEEMLKFPSRKESITNNWPDQQGLDIDTANPYFKEREITLNCAIIADNENDFWVKYSAFIQMLMKPGRRALFVGELSRTFYVIYSSCSQYTRYTRLKTTNKVAAKFTLSLIEPEPLSVLTNSLGIPLTNSSGEYIYG